MPTDNDTKRVREILFAHSPDPSFLIRTCNKTNIPFVFDTAASCSVIPAKLAKGIIHGESRNFSWLSEANVIQSKGKILLHLDFGPRCPHTAWEFHVLEGINFALIGIDYMQHYDVVLYPKLKKVVFNQHRVTERDLKPHVKWNSTATILTLNNHERTRRQLKLAEALSDSDLSDNENQNNNSMPPPTKLRSNSTFPFLEQLQNDSSDDEGECPKPPPVATQIKDLPNIPDSLRNILSKYSKNFDPDQTAHLVVPHYKFDIVMIDKTPFFHRARLIPIKYQKKLRKLLRKYLRYGIIKPALASQFIR